MLWGVRNITSHDPKYANIGPWIFIETGNTIYFEKWDEFGNDSFVKHEVKMIWLIGTCVYEHVISEAFKFLPITMNLQLVYFHKSTNNLIQINVFEHVVILR
jgi:hypothetical protein